MQFYEKLVFIMNLTQTSNRKLAQALRGSLNHKPAAHREKGHSPQLGTPAQHGVIFLRTLQHGLSAARPV